MRELFRNHYIGEEELERLLSMVDDRNMTVHTYNEDLAEDLLLRLGLYSKLMRKVVGKLKEARA